MKATFFVLGQKVSTSAGAAVSERASAEGHWIGNHTFTHGRPFGERDRTEALREVELTERALAWLNQPERLFRPHGGGVIGHHLLHPAVVEKLQADRYTCVLWNSISGDWRDPHGWLARALADCRTREWSLVVLHDKPNGAMAHLDEFLTRLRGDGVEFAQNFPPDCLPIVDGKIVLPIDPYMSATQK